MNKFLNILFILSIPLIGISVFGLNWDLRFNNLFLNEVSFFFLIAILLMGVLFSVFGFKTNDLYRKIKLKTIGLFFISLEPSLHIISGNLDAYGFKIKEFPIVALFPIIVVLAVIIYQRKNKNLQPYS